MYSIYSLRLIHFKLFFIYGYTYFGVNIIGRHAWSDGARFTGDGAYIGAGAPLADDRIASVDIGYLTIQQCKDHWRRHKITFASDDTSFEVDDLEFVRLIKDKYNWDGWMSEDSEYYELIKDIGLIDEYNRTKELFLQL